MDRGVLSRATSADSTPTPGYLFNEIAEMTHISFDAIKQLETYLFRRLQHSNPMVKLKTLRVIKQVSQKGKAEFRSAVQRRAQEIKVYQGFNAPLDPISGDTLIKAIREEATQTLKALFGRDEYGQMTAGTGTNSRIEGFGSQASTQSSASHWNRYHPPNPREGDDTVNSYVAPTTTGTGTKRYPGFGNMPYDSSDPRSTATSSQIIRSVSSVMNRVLPASVSRQLSDLGWGVSRPPQGCATQHSTQWNSHTPQLHHMPSDPHSEGVSGIHWGFPSTAAGGFSANGMATPARPPTVAREEPGHYESKLVNDICAPGGVRAAPPASVLHEFNQRCVSLDSGIVAKLLLDRALDASLPNSARLRVLTVILSMVQPDSAVKRSMAVHWDEWHLVSRLRLELKDMTPERPEWGGVLDQLDTEIKRQREENTDSKDDDQSGSESQRRRTDVAYVEPNPPVIDLLDLSTGDDSPTAVAESDGLHQMIRYAAQDDAPNTTPAVSTPLLQLDDGSESVRPSEPDVNTLLPDASCGPALDILGDSSSYGCTPAVPVSSCPPQAIRDTYSDQYSDLIGVTFQTSFSGPAASPSPVGGDRVGAMPESNNLFDGLNVADREDQRTSPLVVL